jgi:catechol 2,3-dioxygenase-like lactoylglutathione lyase family enzyme
MRPRPPVSFGAVAAGFATATVAGRYAALVGEQTVMPGTNLVHVGVAATDLDRSLRFWRDVLGLEVMDERESIVVLSDGAHNFTVFEYARSRPPHVAGNAGYLHIGVQVANLAETLHRCLDLGLKIICDDIDDCRPFDSANPPRQSFKVEDPDGIVVDVTASDDQWLGVTPRN